MNYTQISIFLLQGFLIASLILLLFRLRNQLGLGLLFTCLGLFQLAQVILSSTVYFEVAKNIIVSPGSSVMFTATLFAILIIYIKEDASEIRKIIYALVIVNVIMAILLKLFSWNMEDLSQDMLLIVSSNLFNVSSWVLFVGTLTLFIDSILIMILYEFISKKINSLFLSISMTMLVVVSFDTIFFSLLSFWNNENLSLIIYSGIISKAFFAIFYSILFGFYLEFLDVKGFANEKLGLKDIFHLLSYRQKFEIAALEIQARDIKYKILTDISPVGIFQTKSDGYTTFVNKKWAEISGLSEEKALGNGWMDAVHPDDIDKIKDEWLLAIKEKRESNIEYRFLKNDGSVKWVLGKAATELNSENQIIGFVGTITDITDLKIYQQEQIRLKKKAEESDQLKSSFLANMSHEIRTPMNGIQGFLEILQDPDLEYFERKEFSKTVIKSGDRLLQTINNIIEFSMIDSEDITVYNQNTNISEVLEEHIKFFELEANQKGIQVSVNIDEKLNNTIIHTDKNKLNSILINLIKNAIKFTDKGFIKVTCKTEQNKLKFGIQDSGCGIDKEKQDIIFDRFRQIDTKLSRDNEGSGLGLAISKAYVNVLGGEIWVESDKNFGSTFYFTIDYKIV